MDFNEESEVQFEVEFTEQFTEELIEIYEYISIKLKEDNAAKRLLNQVVDRVLELGYSPERCMKIGKTDKLKRDYHRLVIKHYVVLYTIDYENKKVFASHIVYVRRNYLG